jgi:hypothetical protein
MVDKQRIPWQAGNDAGNQFQVSLCKIAHKGKDEDLRSRCPTLEATTTATTTATTKQQTQQHYALLFYRKRALKKRSERLSKISCWMK